MENKRKKPGEGFLLGGKGRAYQPVLALGGLQVGGGSREKQGPAGEFPGHHRQKLDRERDIGWLAKKKNPKGGQEEGQGKWGEGGTEKKTTVARKPRNCKSQEEWVMRKAEFAR